MMATTRIWRNKSALSCLSYRSGRRSAPPRPGRTRDLGFHVVPPTFVAKNDVKEAEPTRCCAETRTLSGCSPGEHSAPLSFLFPALAADCANAGLIHNSIELMRSTQWLELRRP